MFSTVQLCSCKYALPREMKTQELISSQLVCGILESCQGFRKMNCSPDFVCILCILCIIIIIICITKLKLVGIFNAFSIGLSFTRYIYQLNGKILLQINCFSSLTLNFKFNYVTVFIQLRVVLLCRWCVVWSVCYISKISCNLSMSRVKCWSNTSMLTVVSTIKSWWHCTGQ